MIVKLHSKMSNFRLQAIYYSALDSQMLPVECVRV